MQRPCLILALILAATISAFAQTPAKTPNQTVSPEESVLQVTREWLAAEESHDRPALRRIIADDFQGIGPRGNILVKEEVIPEEGSQGGLAITASDMKARIFGDTAVVTARGVSKKGELGELRFTVVFVKRDNRWQMVAGHLSAVPKE